MQSLHGEALCYGRPMPNVSLPPPSPAQQATQHLSPPPISQLRRLGHILHVGVTKKFPDSEWPVAIGGFFFLRYLCPAVVTPEVVSPELNKRMYTVFPRRESPGLLGRGEEISEAVKWGGGGERGGGKGLDD